MGLDMYLYTKSQGLAKHMYDWHITNGYWANKYDGWRLSHGIIGYWRKANQIHEWMVKNVQRGTDDCRPHEITPEDMKQLVELCDRVLEAHDTEVSDSILPTGSGFFFGSTDYDEYYYKDVEYTKALLEEIMKNVVFENSYNTFGFYRYVDDHNWNCGITYLSSW